MTQRVGVRAIAALIQEGAKLAEQRRSRELDECELSEVSGGSLLKQIGTAGYFPVDRPYLAVVDVRAVEKVGGP